jgi:diaminopimelate decarboxylase
MDRQRYAIGRHGRTQASCRHEPLCPRSTARLAQHHGTPLWVYDAATMRARIAELRAFDTIRYAQKANSNLHLLRLMRAQGVVVDAVSLGEIERALAAGYHAGATPGIVFTADLFDRATLARVVEHGIPVNAGSVDMLHQLGARSPGHRVWLRINPGFGHGHSNKTNTGGEHSKHGIWHADLPLALARPSASTGCTWWACTCTSARAWTMATCSRCAAPWSTGGAGGPADLQAISAGGGLSIPYRAATPASTPRTTTAVGRRAPSASEAAWATPVRLEIEPGRYLVAESRACCWPRCGRSSHGQPTTSCWSTPASTN